MIKEDLEKAVKQALQQDISLQKGERFGDFFVSPRDVAILKDDLKISPEEIAQKIFSSADNFLEKAVFEGGYINLYLKSDKILDLLQALNDEIQEFLKSPNFEGQTFLFDYSGPNIAKPFSVGHLRSTVIGQANYNIHKALGAKTIGVNHLGDWGTQFGKLIYAIKTWGNEEEIAKNPIKNLTALYVRFHQEAETDENINESAREWFKRLEDGDKEARRLWEKCVAWSMDEFNRIYEIIGIKIDHTQGESFYEDKLQDVIGELKEKGLLKESQGAQIVELEGLPPALIQKKDLATLYLTRDLAALKYRIETYKPTKIIYHVGNDQALHFQQLIAVAEKLGYLKQTQIELAAHGLIRLEGGKMSTRKGHVVLLDEIISEAKDKAKQIIKQKNPDLKDIDGVAEAIGVSAIKYADLNQNRKSDIVFSFDKVVALKGNSGPYLQYTYARAASILRKLDKQYPGSMAQRFLPQEAMECARHIIGLPEALEQSARNSSPNVLCDFTYKLCEIFNTFYESKKIISEDQAESAKNAYIVLTVKNILAVCFELIGLTKLEEI